MEHREWKQDQNDQRPCRVVGFGDGIQCTARRRYNGDAHRLGNEDRCCEYVGWRERRACEFHGTALEARQRYCIRTSTADDTSDLFTVIVLKGIIIKLHLRFASYARALKNVLILSPEQRWPEIGVRFQ